MTMGQCAWRATWSLIEPSISRANPPRPREFGESSGGPAAIAVENFQMLRARQTTDTIVDPGDRAARVNLLNWDGKGRPPGLFPPSASTGQAPPGQPDDDEPPAGTEPRP
jgi:nitrate reductase beta subunit